MSGYANMYERERERRGGEAGGLGQEGGGKECGRRVWEMQGKGRQPPLAPSRLQKPCAVPTTIPHPRHPLIPRAVITYHFYGAVPCCSSSLSAVGIFSHCCILPLSSVYRIEMDACLSTLHNIHGRDIQSSQREMRLSLFHVI